MQWDGGVSSNRRAHCKRPAFSTLSGRSKRAAGARKGQGCLGRDVRSSVRRSSSLPTPRRRPRHAPQVTSPQETHVVKPRQISDGGRWRRWKRQRQKRQCEALPWHAQRPQRVHGCACAVPVHSAPTSECAQAATNYASVVPAVPAGAPTCPVNTHEDVRDEDTDAKNSAKSGKNPGKTVPPRQRNAQSLGVPPKQSPHGTSWNLLQL